MTIDQTTAQLLDHLHRAGKFGYWWTMEGRQSFWWEVGKRTPLPGGRRNTYVGVHPTTMIPETNPRGERKPSREVRSQLGIIAALNCLYTEYDAKDFGGNKAAARAKADAVQPPPSILVDSGGGYHLYWLFVEPWIMGGDNDREHAKRLQAAWVAYAGGDKAVKDLARVLRVPGTHNYKYTPAPQVEIVYADFTRLYAPDELAAHCVAFFEQENLPRTSALPSETPNGPADREVRYARAALDREVAAVVRSASGMKHDTIRNSAIKLGTLVGRGLLDEQHVLDEITRAANLHRDDVADTYRTAIDGLAYGKSRPRVIPPAPTREGDSPTPRRAEPEPWGAPIPFTSPELPSFPTTIFPAWLRSFVEAEAEATQTPPDLSGMLALSILATCAQRWAMVEGRSGWTEPVNVYTVVALPPASRKSAVFRAFTAPLVAHEQQAAERARSQIAEVSAKKDILEQQLDTAKREAAKAKKQIDVDAAMERVNTLAEEVAAIVVPPPPRLIVDDVTPEALASLIAEQGGKMAALSPEGDVFAIMAGRYSGTSGPNFSVFLKAHAGDTLRVDRRTRSEFVDWPALTLGITTQPDVVRGLAEKAGFRGQGLLGRFLYALPKSLVGYRNIDAPPVPVEVRQDYHAGIKALLRMRETYSANSANSANSKNDRLIDDQTNIYYLVISEGAIGLLRNFLLWLEPQLAENGAFATFTDWAGKLAGAVLRVAGLLHLAALALMHSTEMREHSHNSHNSQNEIQAETLADALRLAQYLITHAKAAFAEMGADPAIANARRALLWIERRDKPIFTKRELFEGIKGTIPKADDLDPVLKLLCDHGHIRQFDTEDINRPGRKPSPSYEVNPSVLDGSHNSHNSHNSFLPPPYPFELPTRKANANGVYANGFVNGYREVAGFESDAAPAEGWSVQLKAGAWVVVENTTGVAISTHEEETEAAAACFALWQKLEN